MRRQIKPRKLETNRIQSKITLQSHLNWLISKYMHHVWVRATAFSLIGIIAACLGYWLRGFFPDNLNMTVSESNVTALLTIIASSMLSVSIFTLSTVISTFNSLNNTATPRATVLLAQDPTAQNVLSVFIGAFIYSLFAIIMLRLASYDNTGRVILYFITIFMVILIVITLLRWIDYAHDMARVSGSMLQIERKTISAFHERKESPLFGGNYWDGLRSSLPPEALPVYAKSLGYVEHFDISALQSLAETWDAEIYVNSIPGEIVHSTEPVAYIVHPKSEILTNDIFDATSQAFSVNWQRSYDHDPRFGLCTLSEIGLKTSINNNPGTAIDILTLLARVLGDASSLYKMEVKNITAMCKKIYVRPLKANSLFADSFYGIAREGAKQMEVNFHLQKMLGYLASLGIEDYTQSARIFSEMALKRTLEATQDSYDQENAIEAAAPILGKDIEPYRKKYLNAKK